MSMAVALPERGAPKTQRALGGPPMGVLGCGSGRKNAPSCAEAFGGPCLVRKPRLSKRSRAGASFPDERDHPAARLELVDRLARNAIQDVARWPPTASSSAQSGLPSA